MDNWVRVRAAPEREEDMFKDRAEAGRMLAAKLAAARLARPVVLALPRGGVPVGAEIARILHSRLDLVLVRKVGVPSQPELAAAAVVDGERPRVILNPPVLRAAGLEIEDLQDDIDRETRELERRRRAYLKDRPRVPINGLTAIVVDDGIATGTTIRAALEAIRAQRPSKLILAVPVAPTDTLGELAPLVDGIVCLEKPEPFHAVGLHYADFHQISDAEVIDCLNRADLLPARPGLRSRTRDAA
jgi:putative phosphoribosyl transferase